MCYNIYKIEEVIEELTKYMKGRIWGKFTVILEDGKINRLNIEISKKKTEETKKAK